MTLPPLPPPVWIDTQERLLRMVDDLSRTTYLAVDTEANSLFVYQEQVCLIQISTGKIDYLVDTLAIKDLSPMGPLFSNPKIEKIFHAAEYDIIGLKRDYRFKFTNLFDTMWAGRVLGRTALGLSGMVEECFDVHLEKKYQRANWGKRPIPHGQLVYAQLDSHYLIPLRHHLYEALHKTDRWPLAEEDFLRLCNTEVISSPDDTDKCQMVSSKTLTYSQKQVLVELCKYRDQAARRSNLPPFKILGKQTLIEIAQATPQTQQDLEHLPSLSIPVIQRHAKGLLEAVKAGLTNKTPLQNNSHRPDEQYINRLDLLRAWRKQTAQSIGVESDIALPRDILENIAAANPKSIEELSAMMVTIPWRFKRFGAQILELLQGN